MFSWIENFLRKRKNAEITPEEAAQLREAERCIQAHTLLRKGTITPEEYEDLLRK